MGCSNCAKRKAELRKLFNLDEKQNVIEMGFDGVALELGAQCPIDGSSTKFQRRPAPHLRCYRYGHRFPIAG